MTSHAHKGPNRNSCRSEIGQENRYINMRLMHLAIASLTKDPLGVDWCLVTFNTFDASFAEWAFGPNSLLGS